jgi:hypothetical protein
MCIQCRITLLHLLSRTTNLQCVCVCAPWLYTRTSIFQCFLNIGFCLFVLYTLLRFLINFEVTARLTNIKEFSPYRKGNMALQHYRD